MQGCTYFIRTRGFGGDILLCTRSSVITSVDMLSLTLLRNSGGFWMSSWTKTDLKKLVKASADSLLVLVIVPSACLRGPIVCFTLCFCLMYLCSCLGLDLRSDIIDGYLGFPNNIFKFVSLHLIVMQVICWFSSKILFESCLLKLVLNLLLNTFL